MEKVNRRAGELIIQAINWRSFLSGELRVRSHQCSFDFVV